MFWRSFVFLFISSWILLVVIVWTMPIAFQACDKNSISSNIALIFTESAGKIGTVFLLLLLSTWLAIRHESTRKKRYSFLISFLFFIMVIGGVAYLNEYFTKVKFGKHRPSHQYLMAISTHTITLDSAYKLPDDQRSLYFIDIVSQNKKKLSHIDYRVINHWLSESGYSFPSGHTMNAFLISGILAFMMQKSRLKRLKKLFFIPMFWAIGVAISRVSLGAHTSLDVSVGAVIGMILAGIVLVLYRHFFILQKHAHQ